jgi:tetratricopeptide (TPR) repeat protein
MAVGLGGITAFLAIKLLHLYRRREVRIQSLELKSGTVRVWGWVFAAGAAVWVLFTGHSALAQWDRAWGRHELDRTEVSREEGLSGAFRERALSESHARALEEAYRHFSRADRVGLAPVVEVKLGLAWCHLLRGELDDAARYAREAVAISPGNPELRKNQKDIESALHLEKAGALVEKGDLEGAAREYEALVAVAPDEGPARFNYGGVLRRLGRNDAAIAQLEIARDLLPEDPDVFIELGLSYAATGRRTEAIDALERAIALNPDSPEARMHLPGVIEELKRGQSPISR